MYSASDPGVTLRAYLTRSRVLSVTNTYRILQRTAAALDDIHSKGFVSGKLDIDNVYIRVEPVCTSILHVPGVLPLIIIS